MSGWRYAFSLSKEEVASMEPPGTSKLIEYELSRTQTGTEHRDDNLILKPHPSNSPADPLNWPKWRKYAILFTMSLYAGVADFTSASPSAALPIMQYQMLSIPPTGPPRSLASLTHLIAYNVLLFGASNIIIVPLSNVFGRRPVLLGSLLLFTLCSMWCGLAGSFTSLLAARAVQGLGGAAADTIAPDILGEVFFLHEHGRVLTIYTLFLAGGSYVGGISGGYIAGNLNYRYIFWISTALSGFTLLCVLFLVPETLFDRKGHMNATEAHSDSISGDAEKSDAITHEESGSPKVVGDFTYAQSLKTGLYRGNVVRHFLGPWYSLLFPGTWVVMLHYGGLLGGVVTMSTVAPIFLSEPPYLWGKNVGLITIGALIGTILAAAVTYLVSDFVLERGAKKSQNGIAEPESRLPAMFPALFLSTTGFWVFGFCAANPSSHAWVGLGFGAGMLGFGVTQVPAIGFAYIIESYNAISSDCFVMVTMLRAIISFAWTFFVAQWIEEAGAALPFGIFGMLMAIFALLTIPLWWYGKRMRIATAHLLPKEINH